MLPHIHILASRTCLSNDFGFFIFVYILYAHKVRIYRSYRQGWTTQRSSKLNQAPPHLICLFFKSKVASSPTLQYLSLIGVLITLTSPATNTLFASVGVSCFIDVWFSILKFVSIIPIKKGWVHPCHPPYYPPKFQHSFFLP